MRSRLRPEECSEKSQLFPAAAGPRNGVDSQERGFTQKHNDSQLFRRIASILEPPESLTGFTNVAGTKDPRTRIWYRFTGFVYIVPPGGTECRKLAGV